MTKKDYEALAKVFRNAKTFGNAQDGSLVYSSEITEDFANVLESDNPRFDRSRFLAACRGEDSRDSVGRKVTYAR